MCVCVGASDGRAEPGSQETPLLTSDSCVLVWRRGSEITCVFVTGRSLVCEWHGDGGRDPSPIRPVCFIDYSYTHTLDVQVQDFLCNCVVFFTFLIKADSLVPGRVPVLDGLWKGMMEAPPPWAEIPLLPHVLWGPRDGGRGAGIAAHLSVGHGAVTQAELTQPLSRPGAPLPTALRKCLGFGQAAGESGMGGETECVCQPTQAVPSSTRAPEPDCNLHQ